MMGAPFPLPRGGKSVDAKCDSPVGPPKYYQTVTISPHFGGNRSVLRNVQLTHKGIPRHTHRVGMRVQGRRISPSSSPKQNMRAQEYVVRDSNSLGEEMP
jgi:hypothetical protein